MSVRPTALGLRALVFLGVLWATFFAIPYTNLYFFGVTFLTVWAGLAGFWTWRNLCGMRVRARAVCGPAGMPLRVQFDAEPRGRARTSICVVLELADGQVRSGPVHIAGTEELVTTELPPRGRGIHRVGRATLESSAPFGLFCVRIPLRDLAELVVYPAPIPRRAPRGRGSWEKASGQPAEGKLPPRSHQVAGLREYRDGDDMRHVHWRGTARRGALVVRELDAEPETSHQIVLDRRCAAEALEAALESIVTAALVAREEKATLGLLTQGLARTFACDGTDFDALLRILAELQTLAADAPPPAVGTARGRGVGA